MYLPPVDSSVSLATSSLAWALSLHDVSYAQITKEKHIFTSEKEFLIIHTKNNLHFSFRFKNIGSAVPVDVNRVKNKLDEALAAVQAKLSQHSQANMNRRVSLPNLVSNTSKSDHSAQSEFDAEHKIHPAHLNCISSTPVPSSSLVHLPRLHSSHSAPPIVPTHVESSLVCAPALPLPRCLCVCACHCMMSLFFMKNIVLSSLMSIFHPSDVLFSPALFPGTCKFHQLRMPVLVFARASSASLTPFLTIQQAIALTLQNQQQQHLDSRSNPQRRDSHHQSAAVAPMEMSSAVGGGGIAALMKQEQKAWEGDNGYPNFDQFYAL
jgi:hypothetical protein